MKNYLWYSLAAVGEIGGCYAFWSWLRLGKSPLWVVPGILALSLFAFFLTRASVDSGTAGRAYAAYGGIYIVASLVWLRVIEGAKPDRWDLVGAAVCFVGMTIILFGPRGN